MHNTLYLIQYVSNKQELFVTVSTKLNWYQSLFYQPLPSSCTKVLT